MTTTKTMKIELGVRNIEFERLFESIFEVELIEQEESWVKLYFKPGSNK